MVCFHYNIEVKKSAGIATSSGFGINLQANMGLVSQVFNEENISKLSGGVGIGHTRYSTMGGVKKIMHNH